MGLTLEAVVAFIDKIGGIEVKGTLLTHLQCVAHHCLCAIMGKGRQIIRSNLSTRAQSFSLPLNSRIKHAKTRIQETGTSGALSLPKDTTALSIPRDTSILSMPKDANTPSMLKDTINQWKEVGGKKKH